jgi:hypothetical protein
MHAYPTPTLEFWQDYALVITLRQLAAPDTVFSCAVIC